MNYTLNKVFGCLDMDANGFFGNDFGKDALCTTGLIEHTIYLVDITKGALDTLILFW